MQDQELFDLCKAAYEKTGWDNTDTYQLAHFTMPIPPSDDLPSYEVREGKEFKSEHWTNKKIPLYTSDYILEKLPKQLEHPAVKDEWHTVGVSWHIDKKKWCADYERSMLPYGNADTPLKALLKLTLALHEAG